MKMTGNTILITGGGTGIGRGLAEAFHALGNQIIISGRTQKSLDEVTSANPGMKSMTVDMTNAASIAAFADAVTKAYPALNVLINNAGIMKDERIAEAADDFTYMDAVVSTNLLGPMRLTAALLPSLLTQSQSAVLNVTSGLAFVTRSIYPSYCATKSGIHAYTEALRWQLKGTSVQAIEIIPPYVQTMLTGEHHATDPNAMPLGEYINETMSLLADMPESPEVLVERVKPLRSAERTGSYEAIFERVNGA